MNLEVVTYRDAHASAWDELCVRAVNATWLHTRRFLAYHGTRFEDASVLVYAAGTLVGVLPAARAPQDRAQVISHPGATYGGLVHEGWLSGERMVRALDLLMDHYRILGFGEILYKPLPFIYARAPAQDDLYALFRLGAQCARCELSSTIDLAHRRTPSERRRRALKRAQRTVTVIDGRPHLAALWQVLTENLQREHSAQPVHTLHEIVDLVARFPAAIQVWCAEIAGRVEAGVVLFNSATVWHAQYIASSETGYKCSALDAVFNRAIEVAEQRGIRYFDFGTSNEQAGRVLNEGLYRFKSEFGGGGMVHEHYRLDLTRSPAH